MNTNIRISKLLIGFFKFALIISTARSACANQPQPNQHSDISNNAHTSQSNPLATTSHSDAIYPFSAEHLWKQLLKLIALPYGRISRTEVEQSFNVKLHFDKEISEYNKGEYYGVIVNGIANGHSWYFSLSLLEKNPEKSRFYFTWTHSPNQPYAPFQSHPKGMCINAQSVIAAIEANGWHEEYDLTDTSHGIPSGKQYTKADHAKLVIFFEDSHQNPYLMPPSNSDSFLDTCLLNLEIRNE